MILNRIEYTEIEILAALCEKGYVIVAHDFYFEDQTFPNDFEVFKRTLKCAIKPGEIPEEKNIWENVAIKEFEKFAPKPKLI